MASSSLTTAASSAINAATNTIASIDACKSYITRSAAMNTDALLLTVSAIWTLDHARGELKGYSNFMGVSNELKEAATSIMKFYNYLRDLLGEEVMKQANITYKMYQTVSSLRTKFYLNGYVIDGDQSSPDSAYDLFCKNKITSMRVSHCMYYCFLQQF
jgi:hypothetical protein